MAFSRSRTVTLSPVLRPALLASLLVTWSTQDFLTVTVWSRLPARSTMTAVIILVMLPIGRCMVVATPHSFLAVSASYR
ncbi:MAG TPA: hypothetical protein VE198_11105 [Actinoallomurus sp.]|jgi:hypothetical protein|nr:hypothetical protein [Actinoallomurus sp.]